VDFLREILEKLLERARDGADKQIGQPLGLTPHSGVSVLWMHTQLSIIFDVGVTLSLIIIYPSYTTPSPKLAALKI